MSVFASRPEPRVLAMADTHPGVFAQGGAHVGVHVSSAGRPSVLVSPVGARGAPGGEASGNLEASFAFGDATPVALGTAQGIAVALSLVITEAFNGVGAQLSVGTAGSPELLMAVAQNAPGEIARYEANPGFPIANQPLFLFITPGVGATQGAGVLFLEIAT